MSQVQVNHFNKKSCSSQQQYVNTYNFNKFAKGSGYKASPEKQCRAYASTASESDSSGSHVSSELSGFKIVHSGRVLHDETEEDEIEVPTEFDMIWPIEVGTGKFASSVMVMGPNAQEISLPTFA